MNCIEKNKQHLKEKTHVKTKKWEKWILNNIYWKLNIAFGLISFNSIVLIILFLLFLDKKV